jgi:hypothetical protein
LDGGGHWSRGKLEYLLTTGENDWYLYCFPREGSNNSKYNKYQLRKEGGNHESEIYSKGDSVKCFSDQRG